jgi:hypothetical protein
MTPTILRATVLTVTDPQGLGRVKVQVPQATGTASLWAYPLQDAGAAVPAPGSAVWVLFESGNPALPVYIPPAAYGPWTPVPSGWLAAGWNSYTAKYRFAPGAMVQYLGELNTPSAGTSTTINNGTPVMTLPAALQPALTSSIPVGLLPGGPSNTTAAVLRVNGASLTLYGGPWTYTGTTYLSLAALTYVLSE